MWALSCASMIAAPVRVRDILLQVWLIAVSEHALTSIQMTHPSRLPAPWRWHALICSCSPHQAVCHNPCSKFKAHTILHGSQFSLNSFQLR